VVTIFCAEQSRAEQRRGGGEEERRERRGEERRGEEGREQAMRCQCCRDEEHATLRSAASGAEACGSARTREAI
jgi:hypothetical protein